MNNIINLLNLEDKNIEISKIERDDTAKIKYIYVHTNVSKRFCHICDMRMHSRGTRQRTVNHPMLQDGYEKAADLFETALKFIERDYGKDNDNYKTALTNMLLSIRKKQEKE